MSSVACSGMLAVDYPIVYLSGTYCIYLVAPFVSLVINVWARYRARIRSEEHHKHYCVWCMHLYYRSLRQSLELLSFNTFTPTTTVHTCCRTQTTKTLFSSKHIHKQTPHADQVSQCTLPGTSIPGIRQITIISYSWQHY